MGFPRSNRTQAWMTFLNLLKNDPVLKREVKTWRTWQGDSRSKPNENTKSLPYLLLEPHPDKTKWIDTSTIQTEYVVNVEMGIKADEPSILMDFWSALEAVIYPNDNQKAGQVWSILNRAGIEDVAFEQGDWGNIDEESQGGNLLVGDGRIRLVLQLQLKEF